MIYYTKFNLYLINIKENDNCLSLSLIEKYSYKWNYWILSENPNITEEFIMKHLNKYWNIDYLIKNNKIIDFKALSKFKYINQHIIKKYLNKQWDWEWLIENTDIEVEYYIPFNLIEKYSYKWNYSYLSENPNITEEFILKYPYQNWDIWYLIEKNKITNFKALTKFKEIDQDTIDKYLNRPWDWGWLIKNTDINVKKYKNKQNKNQNITEEFILKYPNKDWNINYLIKNNKITNFKALTKFKYLNQHIIDRYSNKSWDWGWLIENTNIYIEKYILLNLIEKYINKQWDWEWIIENINNCIEKYISFNLIEKYKYKWNYWYLSYNPNITEEFILKYPYQNWDIEYLIRIDKITDFKSLSKFKYLNQKIIDKYRNSPWNWEWIIENTNIYIEDCIPFNLIEKYKYKYKWDYWYLSYNPDLTEEFIMKYLYQNWNIKYLIKKFIFKKFFYKIEKLLIY